MAFNNFPYADLNTVNLDFLLDQQKNITEWVTEQLTNFAQNYVDKAYINANYDADTETLVLYTVVPETGK